MSTTTLKSYNFPPHGLLKDRSGSNHVVSQQEIDRNKDKIKDTLSHFGISIKSIDATVGPAITLYEIVPASGTRISKIKNLEDDLAMSIAALGIRIIAPIPGRGTIGIEVPNEHRQTVDMLSCVTSDEFQHNSYDLPVILGKTVENDVFVKDLAKLPHMLVAGATGQGKSVGLNVIVSSLLYSKTPEELKFVMIDPKRVELSIYRQIDRQYMAKLDGLDQPIITDTSEAVEALNVLCQEMDRRYDVLQQDACRNIKEYNSKTSDKMPYIVLMIDELADLMMTAGKDVEQPLVRLAQLARAVGIHLVVATQRPSADVITGLIKANFPARLSYKVSSKTDSRIILDQNGAEQLIGMGDVLFSKGQGIHRMQCPFIDTPEVQALCDYISGKINANPVTNKPVKSSPPQKSVNLPKLDQTTADAARLVVKYQHASLDMIRHKLGLSFNQALSVMTKLAELGVIAQTINPKSAKVLVDLQGLNALI